MQRMNELKRKPALHACTENAGLEVVMKTNTTRDEPLSSLVFGFSDGMERCSVVETRPIAERRVFVH